MINFFILRCAEAKTYDDDDDDDYYYYYYYCADRATQNNSPDCLYNKKLSCLCFMLSVYHRLWMWWGKFINIQYVFYLAG